YRLLSTIEIQSGENDKAVATLERGLHALPAHPELLWALGDQLVARGDATKLRSTLDELRRTPMPRARIDYLEGRRLLREQNWREAAVLSERFRRELQPPADLLVPLDLFLAQCYEKLGDDDLRYQATRRAFTAAPTSAAACRAYASTLESLG